MRLLKSLALTIALSVLPYALAQFSAPGAAVLVVLGYGVLCSIVSIHLCGGSKDQQIEREKNKALEARYDALKSLLDRSGFMGADELREEMLKCFVNDCDIRLDALKRKKW